MYDTPSAEQVLASTTQVLLEDGQSEAAKLLIGCELELEDHFVWVAPDEGYTDGLLDVKLSAQRPAYDILRDDKHPITKAIREALKVTLDQEKYYFITKLLLPSVTPDWREKLLTTIEQQRIVNQGNQIGQTPALKWNDLRFRSNSEIKIAQALDKAGVLFFPNCMARLGTPTNRRNKEADFLICYEGKWGILEVDGEAYHSTAAKDHDRDRHFRSYGIRVIERFTANQCYTNPETVVRQFLAILKKNA